MTFRTDQSDALTTELLEGLWRAEAYLRGAE